MRTVEPPELAAHRGAIVLGGNFVGLGIVRSLGKRGIPVWVIDSDRSKSIAQFSRYTRRFIECKGPVEHLLLELGRDKRLNGWVLFPVADNYVETISTRHSLLSRTFSLVSQPMEVTRFALDKRLTYEKAASLGVAVPWTRVGRTPEELQRELLPFPVILKPRTNHRFFPQTNIKALPADNLSELQVRYAQMAKYLSPDEILVQERIPGGGENQYSYCALCEGGSVCASLVARRRRQYPIDFGNASTFVETTAQPIVEMSGRHFLEAIGYDGIAEIEFKFDPRDGKYKILDVNPRAWGWHTLGKAAGIDFAYLLWRLKMGLGVSPIERIREVSWCREITDPLALLKTRGRAAELKALLKAVRTRRITFATFDALDPLPFFAEFALWAISGSSRQKKAKHFLTACESEPTG